MMRSLKGLQDAITVDYVNPELTLEHGWVYSTTGKSGNDYPSCARERSGLQPQAQYLYQLYQKGNPEFTGTVSVPILWDKKQQTVVNNDSGQIMEMLNSAFDELCPESTCPDLFPTHLQDEINQLNDYMSDSVTTGVYTCGFAQSQEEYEAACVSLFDALDKLEQRLQGQRYLIPYYPGGQAGPPSPTLADYRLFATLIRFDVVYYLIFKTNIRHIRDYPSLQGFMEDLYSDPAISSTVDFGQIKSGYWWSVNLQGPLNPKDRIPLNSEPFTPKGAFHRRVLGLPEQPGGRKSEPATPGGAEVKQQPKEGKGAFVRGESQHRNWIRADGSSPYQPAKGRYHLYIANNCPWCHRTALTRALLAMEDSITMDVLFYQRDPDRGWQFKPEAPGCTPDTATGGMHFIRQLYEKFDSKEKSVSVDVLPSTLFMKLVPILFDKKTMTIVSNESADIIRMFATECQAMHGPKAISLLPSDSAQLQQLEDVNTWVYHDIANGAYRAGLASSQPAYEAAYRKFFSALDRAELLLSQHKFLLGNTLSEADVRLFPTIFRFDHVYYLRFLLEKAMIVESYPNMQRWLMDFYQLPGVASASNIDQCKKGYFGRHGTNIIPLGPKLSYSFRQ